MHLGTIDKFYILWNWKLCDQTLFMEEIIIIVLIFIYDEKELFILLYRNLLIIYAVWKRKSGNIAQREG